MIIRSALQLARHRRVRVRVTTIPGARVALDFRDGTESNGIKTLIVLRR
jgi:hypothetical protein